MPRIPVVARELASRQACLQVKGYGRRARLWCLINIRLFCLHGMPPKPILQDLYLLSQPHLGLHKNNRLMQAIGLTMFSQLVRCCVIQKRTDVLGSQDAQTVIPAHSSMLVL